MPPTSPQGPLAEKVRTAFERFRATTPIHLRRIPDDLWQLAAELAAATSVTTTARWLGLESKKLTEQVVRRYGPEHPSLPKRRQGKPRSRAEALAKPARSSGPSPLAHQASPREGRGAPSLVGFLEVTPGAIGSPPGLLAEIHSSQGATMRVFSPAAGPLIEAFLRA